MGLELKDTWVDENVIIMLVRKVELSDETMLMGLEYVPAVRCIIL